jgi:hypothetical protein
MQATLLQQCALALNAETAELNPLRNRRALISIALRIPQRAFSLSLSLRPLRLKSFRRIDLCKARHRIVLKPPRKMQNNPRRWEAAKDFILRIVFSLRHCTFAVYILPGLRKHRRSSQQTRNNYACINLRSIDPSLFLVQSTQIIQADIAHMQ